MQFDDLDGQYQIRRDTYQYSFDLASIIVDDRTNAIDGFSQIASCRTANLDERFLCLCVCARRGEGWGCGGGADNDRSDFRRLNEGET